MTSSGYLEGPSTACNDRKACSLKLHFEALCCLSHVLVRHAFDFGRDVLLVLWFFSSELPVSCTASFTPHSAIAQITAPRTADQFARANWGGLQLL